MLTTRRSKIIEESRKIELFEGVFELLNFQKFVIRAILGLFVAVIITRMFRGHTDVYYVIGLAIILVGIAYFSEYLRMRRKR